MSTRSRPPTRRSPSRRPAPRARRRPFPTIVVVVGAVIAGAILLLAVTRDGDDNPTTPALSDDPGVAHVHGLGIDPADGTLYVATHYGTFRVPEDGPAQRVGDSFQDTMGFTVVGARHFLGSGHPDVAATRSGLPGRLGLIQSANGGETWQPVSLLGEADFHALAYAHDRVYGWDAGTGRFMVSQDRRTWDTRSTVDVFSFAIDPTDPDGIVGAGQAGLISSSDGGRTWQPDNGPRLVVVAWDGESGLWGADVSGAVHHSASPDASWEMVGTLPGSPQAFLANGQVLYAAAEEGERTGIYKSTDGGRTWQLRYRDEQR